MFDAASAVAAVLPAKAGRSRSATRQREILILRCPLRLGTVSVLDLIRDTANRAAGGFLTGLLTLKLEGYEK